MGSLQAKGGLARPRHLPPQPGSAQALIQLGSKANHCDAHTPDAWLLAVLAPRAGLVQVGTARLRLEGQVKLSCHLAYPWLMPPLSCPSFPSPAPLPACSPGVQCVGRLLTICALMSLPGASWSGGAYQGPAPVRWAFRSPWARGGGRSPCCRA
jgi:hypothetical protein